MCPLLSVALIFNFTVVSVVLDSPLLIEMVALFGATESVPMIKSLFADNDPGVPGYGRSNITFLPFLSIISPSVN